ncbi:hypothetical protein HYH03_011111 [Edaphochlamys debaryana]|uniref:Uncharacterized protein n=1 Tax=Edaphochlamys debaryana TaxID=47281 RepID=A0A836BVY2_9CHLO|nr:hypothetical protein HYH03_011111 [Edaphochlamys debaryana]|eukprot:KAG2490482.1 hypothetical protein HYH03_011111 [Edaphochlamys debaryana]
MFASFASMPTVCAPTPLDCESDHRACAERRLIDSWAAEARRHGQRPHQVAAWIRRKAGPRVAVWRRLQDGSLGVSVPCVCCRQLLTHLGLSVCCVTAGGGWWGGRLDEPGAPESKPTSAQRRLLRFGQGGSRDETGTSDPGKVGDGSNSGSNGGGCSGSSSGSNSGSNGGGRVAARGGGCGRGPGKVTGGPIDAPHDAGGGGAGGGGGGPGRSRRGPEGCRHRSSLCGAPAPGSPTGPAGEQAACKVLGRAACRDQARKSPRGR